ncbi:hypothetical protein FPOA_13465 [Fusarium poae]|uniref:DDE-1 domain-containing protein n=1 Tax=Fusarium poae TaxID=36050 RepID=A0A1B8A5I2_FUSPO|nr:hypothetical protein FPOA_13465 [Fusarium poae]
MTELLNEKTDGFMIDTQLPQEVRESIRNANFAGKPLNAVDCEESDKEEEEEEEEILPLLDLSCLNDVEMPSSPPCLPNHEPPPDIARLSSPVGKRWAINFINRQPGLKTRFPRRYDYKRAKCEDPTIIRNWFKLVQNTIAKYGIQTNDIWNFDETGFMMGMISTGKVVTSIERRGRPKSVQPGNREWVTVIQGINAAGWTIPPFIIVTGQKHLRNWYEGSTLPTDWAIATSQNGWTDNEMGLEWLKHFNQSTTSRSTGAYRLLILDGHESHHSADFEAYCKEKKIILLCMPPNSSHLLQPLDFGCFGPLKKAHGREIEHLMRRCITHITKVTFFPAFYAAHQAAITESNIKGGFGGAGLVPFDPESVISRLDVQLRTLTPPEGLPKRKPARLNLGPQRHQRLLMRLILIRNTLRDESEDIKVAFQSQSLKLFSLLLKQ